MLATCAYAFAAFRLAAQYFFIRALTALRASADIFRRRRFFDCLLAVFGV